MFVCEQCAEKYEGPAVEWALAGGFKSRGKCELCDETPRDCYDIPSSASWWKKKKGKAKA